jgi:hypothetical protein
MPPPLPPLPGLMEALWFNEEGWLKVRLPERLCVSELKELPNMDKLHMEELAVTSPPDPDPDTDPDPKTDPKPDPSPEAKLPSGIPFNA